MVHLTISRPGQHDQVVVFDHPSEVTVGRSAGSTFCLDFDPMVSRMHAVILIDPPTVRIKDLNSTNGIVINGVTYGGASGKTLDDPHVLASGDSVGIGTTTFRVGVDAAAGDRAGAPDVATVGSFRIRREPGAEMSATAGVRDTIGALPPELPQIPNFTVTALLGLGRLGNVYQATGKDGENVAIRVVTPEVAFTKKMLEDLRREVDNAKRVRHPNIVALKGAGSLGPKSFFLVHEFVNGENLQSYLDRYPDRRLPLRLAYPLMLQLAAAMCHAHGLGFVHRDLKPASILMYTDGGQVMAKITDIGLANFLEDSGLTGLRGYSPDTRALEYTPPEQVREFREAKSYSDVFSLAAIFYEMLTGCGPYRVPEGSDVDRRLALSDAPIIPIEERTPGLPEPLVVVIDRALSTEPEERYQNCCDLLEALQNVRV
ncbi:MAG: FHA domain-containing serine/threonine-protein kinase [Planctomycetes bacterium]|nr:FHA domain-containing serine/threonine-protein kinase [Planctomycetota bacterium]